MDIIYCFYLPQMFFTRSSIATSVRRACIQLGGVQPTLTGLQWTFKQPSRRSWLKAYYAKKLTELTENMFSAICSWTYNLGSGAVQRSSLRWLYLNEGRYEEAADEFLRWVYCNGKRLRGLVLRRTDERTLFLA